MAMTAKEKDDAFRQRRYEAGFKQMRIWVPRESEINTEKLERKEFLLRLEALTAGWSKAKLSKLFSQILKDVNKKIKEEEK
jgi:hypothetical protein